LVGALIGIDQHGCSTSGPVNAWMDDCLPAYPSSDTDKWTVRPKMRCCQKVDENQLVHVRNIDK